MPGKERRKDKSGKMLKMGESQRKDGYYTYRWTSRNGKRHCVTAKSLSELREKEAEIQKDTSDGIRADIQSITVNDIYALWRNMKRGLKDNTFQNYQYMYGMFVEPDLGKLKITALKKSDIKRFYNCLAEERGLKVSTIDSIHTVLHQVLDTAVDDGYLRHNPSDNVLKELKQSHNFGSKRRKALTAEEQELFLDFLRKSRQYRHWYPIFAVMAGTGMRVGEITGLRWEDIDLEEGMIDINHTLVYYNHATDGCYFNCHTPKTEAGKRRVPMLSYVKEAFLEEQRYQEINGIQCKVTIDEYTDFIFVNRFGTAQHQGTLNKALRRIIRDCNDEILLKCQNPKVLLPRFSCHSLRHSFTTRLVEQNVNLKVIQDCLGHKDIETTLNIYADVTNGLRKKEFDQLERKMNGDIYEKPGKGGQEDIDI